MAYCSSYYLYQRYEKRGDQDWIPSYPNVYSIDGEGSKPLRARQMYDSDCGWIPDTEVQNRTLSGTPYCTGYDLYVNETYQVSYDGGVTWETTGNENVLVERNSTDCGYVPPTPDPIYRWTQITPISGDASTYICDDCNFDPQYRTTSGTPYCSNGNEYVDVYSQVSYDEGETWATTATTQTLVHEHSSDCGYRTRMLIGEPYCSGFDKYRDYDYQVSTDSGVTWATTATTHNLIEADSADCGYAPGVGDYFTFEAISNCKFKFMPTSGDGIDNRDKMKYTLDSGSTWNTISNGEYVYVPAGNKVMWKGYGFTPVPYTAVTSAYGGIGTFRSSGGTYNVYGNVMSLIYGDSFAGREDLNDYTFSFLFCYDEGLVSAENLVLPSTILTSYCYQEMFLGCTSLTKVPNLPAPNLNEGCYYGMFLGCSSLTTVPSNLLSAATSTAKYCYSRMFENCTSLTNVPSLPATYIGESCYHTMFEGCTSLTTVPSNLLPATTLNKNCYYGMFSGCSGLTNAPSLPATYIDESSYALMFFNCSSLRTAPTLPAMAVSYFSYLRMFYGCRSLTTAPNLPATTLEIDCYKGMFSNCTSLTTTPSMPATNLKQGCYQEMFSGCTSLTSVTDLPATRLTFYTYRYMFKGCSRLRSVKCLATNITASECLKDWLAGVSSTGTFYKNSAIGISSWPRGSSGIPSNWSYQNA